MDDDENIWIKLPKKVLDPKHKWRFDKKRFNGEIELGTCPDILTGTDIEELLAGYENYFGKKKVKYWRMQNCNSTEVTSHRRSTPMTNQQDLSNATVNLNSATVRRRLDLLNPPDEHEATDENEILDLPLPPPPPLTEFDKKTCININNLPEYERLKILNVMQNNEVYKAMKLPTLAICVRNEFRKCKGKEKMQQESDEYIPPEHEEQSENETVKTPKKRTKKVEKTKLNIGPTTRSRANILVEKDESEKDVRNSVPAEPAPECAIQLPRNEGIGIMAAYLLLRDNQKKNAGNGSASGSGTAKGKAVAENDLPDIENEVVDEAAAPKRRRGRTRMDKVHTRSVDKRVVIHMNKEFQPISDNDKVVSELNNFLGTLRRCVPLTYKSWTHVPRTLKQTLWNYVKQRYIILDELEKYCLLSINESWKGQKCRIKKNHYLAYETDEERLEHRPEDIPLEDFKLLLMYWGDEKVQELAKANSEHRKLYTDTHTAGPKTFAQIKNKLPVPSVEAVFLKTRKRKPGRKYKTDTAVMNYRLEKIEKAMAAPGGSSGIDELISDGDLCATISTDNEYGTPMTGGPSS
ncbi:hypothetical protein POM88_015467 [Heracleum sosnowskyi]|uniref:Uncharacterized protein n=1 Tax=Heracleum sosnowskyi TaxID=360622 RepID=A0AAD8MW86_9APIA|nr:hypothetical protein POM88_015467 [Heracleum sosnowskyi]